MTEDAFTACRDVAAFMRRRRAGRARASIPVPQRTYGDGFHPGAPRMNGNECLVLQGKWHQAPFTGELAPLRGEKPK